MANITSYIVQVFGGPSGYKTNRSEIFLKNGIVGVGYIRFNDPGMAFEADFVSDNLVFMHLPSTMFQSVLDILRNEKPLNISFSGNNAFFTTNAEPIGEGE